MRRNWKRILSLLLTLAMIFTMNTTTFAEITPEGGGTKATGWTVSEDGKTTDKVVGTADKAATIKKSGSFTFSEADAAHPFTKANADLDLTIAAESGVTTLAFLKDDPSDAKQDVVIKAFGDYATNVEGAVTAGAATAEKDFVIDSGLTDGTSYVKVTSGGKTYYAKPTVNKEADFDGDPELKNYYKVFDGIGTAEYSLTFKVKNISSNVVARLTKEDGSDITNLTDAEGNKLIFAADGSGDGQHGGAPIVRLKPGDTSVTFYLAEGMTGPGTSYKAVLSANTAEYGYNDPAKESNVYLGGDSRIFVPKSDLNKSSEVYKSSALGTVSANFTTNIKGKTFSYDDGTFPDGELAKPILYKGDIDQYLENKNYAFDVKYYIDTFEHWKTNYEGGTLNNFITSGTVKQYYPGSVTSYKDLVENVLKGKNNGEPETYVLLAVGCATGRNSDGDPVATDDFKDDDTGVSANFIVKPRTAYIKPVYTGNTSGDIPKAGTKFVKADFDYELYDAKSDGNELNKATYINALDLDYYVNGKKIDGSVSFNAGTYTISANITSKADQVPAKYLISQNEVINGSMSVVESDNVSITFERGVYANKFYVGDTDVTTWFSNIAGNKNDFEKFLAVKAGDIDLTDKATISFNKKSDDDKDTNWKAINTFTWADITYGDTIYFKATYGSGDDARSAKTTLVASQQPIAVSVNKVETYRGGDLVTQVELKKGTGTHEVSIYKIDKDGSFLIGSPIKSDVALGEVQTSSANIITTGITTDRANSYKDIPIDKTSLSLNKLEGIKNYTVVEANVLEYEVKAAYTLSFKSARDGSTISMDQIYTPDGTTLRNYNGTLTKDGPLTISVNTAEELEQWTYVIHKEAVPMRIGTDVTQESNKFLHTFTSTFINSINSDITFYLSVKEAQVANTSGTISVDAIAPVVYNGNKWVTEKTYQTKPTKKTSTFPNLKITAYPNTDAELEEGVDYTVSYKNNTNIGYASDKNGPKVIVTGKNAYKGLKLTIGFTILPQSFKYADVDLKSQYIALTKNGKLKLGETVKVGGTKVSNKFYDVYYYRGGKLLTQSQLASYYTGNELIELDVKLVSKANGKKLPNFAIGEVNDECPKIYAYPKGSKSLKVTLANKGKISYSEKNHVKVSDFISSTNATIKQGKNELIVDGTSAEIDSEELKFYTDKNLTKLASADGETTGNGSKILWTTGTYYVKVMPTAAAMKKYNVFKPTAVKITFAGTKLNKKLVSLASTKLGASDSSGTLSLKQTDALVGKGYALYMVAEDHSIYDEVNVGDELCAVDSKAVRNNNVITQKSTTMTGATYDFVNLAEMVKGAGKHTIIVKGIRQYTGTLKLNYQYAKASAGTLKKQGFVVSINNAGKNVLPVNVAGYDDSFVQIKNAKGAVIANGTEPTKGNELYEVDKITWKLPRKAGKGTGSVTVTFKYFSGSLTGKFDAEVTNVNTALNKQSIVIERASTVSGAKAAKVKVKQYKMLTSNTWSTTDSAYLKAGSDYKLSNVRYSADQTTGYVDVSFPGTTRFTGTTQEAVQYKTYAYEMKGLKIVGLSENEAASGYDKFSVSYNAAGKYYEYKGAGTPGDKTSKTNVVAPKVTKVTAVINGQTKEIPVNSFNVSYTPVYGKNSDGKTILTTGTYKVTVTVSEVSGNSLPSYVSATTTYKVGSTVK